MTVRRSARATWRRLVPLLLYHGIFMLFGLAYAPVALWRLVFDPRFRASIGPRSGRVQATVGDRPVVWAHGVSVGEVKGLGRLIAAIEERHPEIEVVVSATTETGFALAQRLYAPRRVIRYPIDFGLYPGRALDRIRPGCVLLMELEVWPNFLQAASRRRIPVAVVNGRISERSFRGYRLVRGLLPQFDWIDLFCVQNEAYRERLHALGVDAGRIAVTGNVKYDSLTLRGAPEGAERLRSWLAADGRLVLVCGSTHAHEEEWLARTVRRVAAALGAPVRLVLVPRHPERAPAVMDAVQAAGTPLVAWSRVGAHWAPLDEDAGVLVDTIGHLEAFYGACDVAFVGGSLVPHGGQNMLEPAGLGRAVVFGPHVANFRTDVELLLEAGAAVQVRDVDELERVLIELFRDADRRADLGRRAVAMIRENQGATERTRRLIEPLLLRAGGRVAAS
jgi:3-deoxy-D-manno-octulosonic-acid transferase